MKDEGYKSISRATTHPIKPEHEPVGEAYLCDLCHTPFDGAFQCPSCGHGRATKEPVYTTPPQRKPLTDEMVLAGARALAKRHADSCGLDFDDVWKYYADEHKDDARAVLEAAHGIKRPA